MLIGVSVDGSALSEEWSTRVTGDVGDTCTTTRGLINQPHPLVTSLVNSIPSKHDGGPALIKHWVDVSCLLGPEIHYSHSNWLIRLLFWIMSSVIGGGGGCIFVFLLDIETSAGQFRLFFNPLTAKLFNLNFHPLEVVSRWRDPRLQVSENYSDLTKWGWTLFKYRWLMSHFIF